MKNKKLVVRSWKLGKFAFLSPNSQLPAPSKGFTLVELLIYMGLLTIMVLIFTDIFTSIIDNQLGSENTSNVADDGRYIYSRFIYDVNRADSIVSPGDFGSSSASLVLVINGVTTTYAATNGSILVTTPASSAVLNGYGTSISSLLFTKVGTPSAADTVRINFTIDGKISTRGISDTQMFQTTAGLR